MASPSHTKIVLVADKKSLLGVNPASAMIGAKPAVGTKPL